MNTFARLGLTAVAVAAIGVVGLTVLRPPTVGPAADLGIFAPVAGRIVSSLWAVDPIAVDPSAPSRSTQLRLGPEKVRPLGWSRDGTELLFMREDPTDQAFPYARHLYILHADGTETQLNRDPMDIGGAAISPDGSRVVYATDGLYVVDADGGHPVRIAEVGSSPTFSPDGSQIAYLVNNSGPGEAQVWVADSDGSDAHAILADEPAMIEGVFDLAWSPTGERIASGNSGEGHLAIYTFGPDGSDFMKVITGGMNPYWSPDGSQIAYLIPYDVPLGGGSPGLAIADADGSNVREFGLSASGPWHPGRLKEPAEAPASRSSSTSPASTSPSPVTPTPGPRSEAEQIIAEGDLETFAMTASGTMLTVWETCYKPLDTECGYAWRLGSGSQPRATGMIGRGASLFGMNGHVNAVASGDGFILTPEKGSDLGTRIAADGTSSPVSMACRDASWSTPTEPGRLALTDEKVVDTVAGTICESERLGGPPLSQAVFTPEGTLWALVDNESDPDAFAIGTYDGAEWRYHDFAAPGGALTSVLAASGATVVVLEAAPRPHSDQLLGLAVTADAGVTWSEVVDPDVLERDLPFSTFQPPPSDDETEWLSRFTSMAFAGSSVLYVADGRGDLWRSTDFATFSRVSVPRFVAGLSSAGDAVIARIDDGVVCSPPVGCGLNELIRISADGTVEPITAR
jgi:Tol biopolymer transport system component